MQLLAHVREQVADVEHWLKRQASVDERVTRLRTNPGVGLLTSLCLVPTLGDTARFSNSRVHRVVQDESVA